MENNAEYQLLKGTVQKGELDSVGLIDLFSTYNFDQKVQWMEKNWSISLYFVSAYLLFIYTGQKYMKNRKPFDLTNALIAWNVALAIFSFRGCYIMLPEFVENFQWHDSVCMPWRERTQRGLHWGWLFMISKVPELFDTAFLVFRKKPVIFLHWYHHISVLLYCWYLYTDENSTGPWFAVMNFVVHSVMYSYYALRAMKINVPSKVSMMVTILQITQMFIGLCVILYASAMKLKGAHCDCTNRSLKLALAMYGSYFVLFGNFFYKAYVSRGGKKKTKATISTNANESIKQE